MHLCPSRIHQEDIQMNVNNKGSVCICGSEMLPKFLIYPI